MTYKFAKQLHNEDEVTVKETGCVLTVVSVDIQKKAVIVMCDDGNEYHHRELK